MLTSGSLMNKDTISFSSNENKMAAITAFWNRRGVVGSQPTDSQLNSSKESADTGNVLTSCYGRLILCIRFWLSEIHLNTQAYMHFVADNTYLNVDYSVYQRKRVY